MKKWWYFVIVPVGLFTLLFFTRLILPTQIDDVSSSILCEQELLETADVYYVIHDLMLSPTTNHGAKKFIDE